MADDAEGDGDVLAQRAGFAGLVQARLAEREQEHVETTRNGSVSEVGDPRGGDRREQAPAEGAEHERRALDHAHAADDRLEPFAVAGLLEHGVVDDGVEGAGLHGEVDAEQQGGDDVGGRRWC